MANATTKPRAIATATDRAPKKAPQPASMTGDAIARRAYELYLARGCEHGHDVEDWLQAERDLKRAASSLVV
jgi:hypothetical protein